VSGETRSGELVRGRDRDSYLASLFAPDDRRPHLLALHAFAIEMATIPGLVSEATIGLVRFQWWHDTLEAIARGEGQGHPVATELAAAIAAHHLPLAALHDMIDAREADLHMAPLADLEALEAYLGRTEGARIQLASLILAGEAAMASARAAGLAGVAWGLARLVDEPARHQLLPSGFTIDDAMALGRQRLAEARALGHTLAPGALPAFLPAGLAGLSRTSPLRRQVVLWWRARHDRF
jgi:phytoene synthase